MHQQLDFMAFMILLTIGAVIDIVSEFFRDSGAVICSLLIFAGFGIVAARFKRN